MLTIMQDKDPYIESLFPQLSRYDIKSPIDDKYNCIAFAADDTERWWEPGRYWPQGVPERIDLDSFIACYKSLGYKECRLNSK